MSWDTLVAKWTETVRECAGDSEPVDVQAAIEDFVAAEGGVMHHAGGGLMVGYVWMDENNCATITDECIHLWRNREPWGEDPETGELAEMGDEAVGIDEIL